MPTPHEADDSLAGMLPPVGAWFRATFGAPSPPQRLGWPRIAAGRNTLILAPTGSGKTLAAFLACLDHLWRNPVDARTVRVLYVSPLKALNLDVSRNLEAPLAGIVATAEAMGTPLPPLSIGVRTGDTTAEERRRHARRPPELFITTPESLHLILTSRARSILRGVTHVIVDEIHALCGEKRGVFLALLLERLEALVDRPPVRIGLSATQRPLEAVARYLGGWSRTVGADGVAVAAPRPVEIVDAGGSKELDLGVEFPANPEGGTVWPAVEARLEELIRSHRSTIVFANNRRVVERLTLHLNERLTEGDAAAEPVRSHHGSLSLDRRRGTEDALKSGDVAAVVATASLELGIDMGPVDLVCQVESPGGIARSLQRVGRAGHAVGSPSKGRILAKTAADLMEAAALTGAMREGAVEALRVPRHCLDILAQQIVACVAVDPWDVRALYDLVRGCESYHDLPAEAFESVVAMVSGRSSAADWRDLKPRVSWDRVHNRLVALPGSQRLALGGGGAIPDTGQFPVYLGDGGPRLGELDEEFIFERRVGEAFVLGTSTWRIVAIEPHRVLVGPAEGQAAVMPFWRGEGIGRTAELGERVGALCRRIAGEKRPGAAVAWLVREACLDEPSARRLVSHIDRQRRETGAVPDDRTVLVESFRDPAGETGVAVLTLRGNRFNLTLKLAIQGFFRSRHGLAVACQHADDGLILRLPGTDEPPLDFLGDLSPEEAEALVLVELGDSALFGLRFRQNASRALLMPRPDPTRRTPLWLQRLRAKDLLQIVRRQPDFPIVVETYRQCLDDDLERSRLRDFLGAIRDGTIALATRQVQEPSPFVAGLLFRFTQTFLYEWDDPKRAASPPDDLSERRRAELLRAEPPASLIDPDAIRRVDARLRDLDHPPRTAEEAAELLRRCGDLTTGEVVGSMADFLDNLGRRGIAARIEVPGADEPGRWVLAEVAGRYRSAFEGGDEDALRSVLLQYVGTRALVGADELAARYGIDPALAIDVLEEAATAGSLIEVPGEGTRFGEARNVADVRRLSVALRRREAVAVSPEHFADFLLRHQRVGPSDEDATPDDLEDVLTQLRGHAAPVPCWEEEILPARLRSYRPGWLDEQLDGGGWAWRCERSGSSDLAGLVPRGFAVGAPTEEPSSGAAAVLALLRDRGPMDDEEITDALGVGPMALAGALQELARTGRATCSSWEPLRRPIEAAIPSRAVRPSRSVLGRSRDRLRRRVRSAARWSALPAGPPDPEQLLIDWCDALLDRYGVIARELAAMDAWAPPWSALMPVLDRAELRGEIRRGYFVEGLSGIQYATEESAQSLARHAVGTTGGPVLLVTTDPANLYGSGAPFDLPLLDGGTARLPRTAANHLILLKGRPVVLLEQHGRRVTTLAGAGEDEIRAALPLIASLARPGRRSIQVDRIDGTPAHQSPLAPALADLGFVRNPPGLAYYAGW